ncbi:hypothetical protein HY504_03600 [Candidatus Wolfebacteria bacterium]|nr:hypothetical protein [Candidatus Wolfebacteria bacterium]
MAIVVEQQKRNINWFALAVVSVSAGVIGLAVYFLFFSPVPLIERVAPAGEGFERIKTVSRIEFRPERVLGNSVFKILRPYGAPEVPEPPASRLNPFAPTR